MTEKSTIDATRIAAKANGRKLAATIWEMVRTDVHPEGVEAFLEKLQELLKTDVALFPAQSSPSKPPVAPSNAIPVARLGKERLDFGMHAGKHLDAVPLDYLDWLCGQTEDLQKRLQSYLKHPGLAEHRRSKGWDE